MIALGLSLVAVVGGEVQLHWAHPQGCPSSRDVLQAVEELTGRPLADGPLQLVVTATVTRKPWRAAFVARSAHGESRRTLVGEDCEAIAQAAAVIIAIALADLRREPAQPPEDWLPDLPRVPQPAVLTLSPIATSFPVRFDLAVASGVHVGVLANAGPVLVGDVVLTWIGADLGSPRWLRGGWRLRLGAFGRWSPDQQAEGLTISYGAAGARADGCWLWPRWTFEVEVCLGTEVGPWWAEGKPDGQRQTFVGAAVLGSTGATWLFSRILGVYGRIGLGVNITRDRVVVQTTPGRPDLTTEVFQPSRVFPRIEAGFSVRF